MQQHTNMCTQACSASSFASYSLTSTYQLQESQDSVQYCCNCRWKGSCSCERGWRDAQGLVAGVASKTRFVNPCYVYIRAAMLCGHLAIQPDLSCALQYLGSFARVQAARIGQGLPAQDLVSSAPAKVPVTCCAAQVEAAFAGQGSLDVTVHAMSHVKRCKDLADASATFTATFHCGRRLVSSSNLSQPHPGKGSLRK